MNDEIQQKILEGFQQTYREEYEALIRNNSAEMGQYYLNNGWFDSVDAEILYCFVRKVKPKRIIEIGSGFSTLISASAILVNEKQDGKGGELISIEPHPSDTLKRGIPGLAKLFENEVQDVPLEIFESLSEGDILFIDSSHALKMGGDVQYEYLEILPRLKKGVLVHIHDIFLPAEYPIQWIVSHRQFWTEQYVLQAFLIFNDSFSVLWGSHYMHREHPELLAQAFSSYQRKDFRLSSFWIERVK